MTHTTPRKCLIAAATAVLLGVLLAGPASARFGGPPGGPGPEHIARMAEELGLSAEQRTAIEKILADSRAQAQPLMQQMRGAHEAMEALIAAPTFDEAAVRQQAQASSGVMSELAVIHARSRHAMQQLLTPEQREKLKTLRPRHRRGHHGPDAE